MSKFTLEGLSIITVCTIMEVKLIQVKWDEFWIGGRYLMSPLPPWLRGCSALHKSTTLKKMALCRVEL